MARNSAKPSGPRVGPATACGDVLRRRLDELLGDLAAHLARAVADPAAESALAGVRAAARGTTGLLAALGDCVEPGLRASITRRAEKLHAAAAEAHELDAIARTLRALPLSAGEKAAARAMLKALGTERAAAAEDLLSAARRTTPADVRSLRTDAREQLDGDGPDLDPEQREARRRTVGDAAHAVLPRLTATFLAAAEQGPDRQSDLRQLGQECEELRDALMIFTPALGAAGERAIGELEETQRRLRAINDAQALAGRVAECARTAASHDGVARTGLASLRTRVRGVVADRRAEFRAWWNAEGAARVGDAVRALAAPTPATNGAAIERRAEGGAVRLAAIDIGSNSVRLIIAEAEPTGSFRVLDDEKENVRLGRGVAATGALDPEAAARTIEVVSKMRRIADGYGVRSLRMVATAAVREASNRDILVGPLEEAAGAPLHVIDAEEEALLAYESAAHHFDLDTTTAAVMDIGGGSMEVVLSSGGVIEHSCSMPLGAVRLTERFGGPEAAAGDRFEEMRRFIDHQIRRHVGKPPFEPQVLIGAGGTATALANISLHQRRSGRDLWLSAAGVRGHEMLRSEVRHILDYLRKLPVRERAKIQGLPADRADIIVAGFAAVERLMKRLNVNRIRVHDGGIREGIILRLIRETFPDASPSAGEPRDPLLAARKLGRSCAFEERHCDHVARLAGRIFDQLAAGAPSPAPDKGQAPWSSRANRTLLEAAALLKDIGYHINYSKHHHHSYHLIMHGGLRGLTAREVEIVANVARYHRRAEPKKSHPNFAKLARGDQELVRRLAAILRIADGLDRTHMGAVRDVALRVSGDEALFVVEAPQNPAVDVWGAERKAGLFEKTFNLRARFDWSPDGAAPGAPAAPANGVAARTRRARASKATAARRRTARARR